MPTDRNPPPYSEFKNNGMPNIRDGNPKKVELIIGIDFGTTFSGISWAVSNSPEDIHVVRSWPTKGNSTYEKVPSEISYKTVEKRDPSVTFDWGFKARRDPDRLQWIKLLLDPTQHCKIEGLRDMMAKYSKLIPKGKDAVGIVTDFFSGLKEQLHEELRRNFGEGFIAATPKKYIFTVPCMWSDKAKSLTEKAVYNAGFIANDKDQVVLIPEPEAAALCCLKTIQPNYISVGDNLIVVDCGGGTVDLSSYTITKLEPAMQVREAVVGTGGLCGSVFLNHIFEDLVRNKIGTKKYENIKPNFKEILMKSFDEEHKKSFSDSDFEEEFYITAPGFPSMPEVGIEDGLLVITREEMREVFRPVIEEIKKLVENQCKSIRAHKGKVDAILLVGGFGSSPYLYKYFKEWAVKKHSGSIQILQPSDAWSCIVRGAVMHGCHKEDIVKTRLSRRHYGICFWEPFNRDHHPQSYKVWNSRRNKWYCDKRAKWFINLGDKIENNSPIEHKYSSDVWLDDFHTPGSKVFKTTLYAYDGNHAPKHIDAPGVQALCEMTMDMTNTPDSFWESANYGKGNIEQIGYKIRMTLRGALLSFESRCNGERYGHTTVKFD